MISITPHAKQRLSNRKSISCPKQQQKDVWKAYKKGTHIHNAPDILQEYIFEVYDKYESTTAVRVYQNFTYVFKGMTLKTILPLPKKLYGVQNGSKRGNKKYYNRNKKQFGR